MSTEIIEYSSSLTDEETENIIKVINLFIIFLKENDIEDEYLIYVIQNDIITQQIIYLFYELITLNFSIFNISEISELLPKEIKGGTIKEMMTFLIILILLSTIFTGVESILFKKPTFKLHTFAKHSMETLSSRIFVSPSRTSPSKTSPSRTSPSKTLSKRIRKRDIIFTTLNTITFTKVIDGLNDRIEKGKKIKLDKLLKFCISMVKLKTEQDLLYIKDALFSGSETTSAIILSTKNKELLDKISLIIKITDTVINILVFGMKINSGLQPTFVEYGLSLLKISTSIGQIYQKLYENENTKLKELLDTISNVFIFKDIGSVIEQLSFLYVGYIVAVIISSASKIKGGKTKRKRKSKRKTKKINQQKKLKYNVHLK